MYFDIQVKFQQVLIQTASSVTKIALFFVALACIYIPSYFHFICKVLINDVVAVDENTAKNNKHHYRLFCQKGS